MAIISAICDCCDTLTVDCSATYEGVLCRKCSLGYQVSFLRSQQDSASTMMKLHQDNFNELQIQIDAHEKELESL